MTLIFRCDATVKIGTGHLMRCFALALAWKTKGGEAVFVTNCRSSGLLKRLENEGFSIVKIDESYPHPADWKVLSEVLINFPNSWCVVDGYHFDSDYYRLIREKGNRVLVLDDTAHWDFYEAEAILNQNINADELKYNCLPETKLLLGTEYALLRREFWHWQNWQREIPDIAEKILVTMGGSDVYNQTLKVIKAIEKLNFENLEVKAVVGASNPHLSELKQLKVNFNLEIISNAENMAELMAWADLAISAAGSTCWEMAFMSLPALLIVIADNQIGLGKGVSEAGFAKNLGWFEDVSEELLVENLKEILPDNEKRQQMSQLGRKIVDGNGATRLFKILQ